MNRGGFGMVSKMENGESWIYQRINSTRRSTEKQTTADLLADWRYRISIDKVEGNNLHTPHPHLICQRTPYQDIWDTSVDHRDQADPRNNYCLIPAPKTKYGKKWKTSKCERGLK